LPKRRTAFTSTRPPAWRSQAGRLTGDLGETFYFKPEAGRVFASPADETPMPPCDVQPDEIDVATAAARVEETTVLEIRRIVRKWRGCAAFVKDKTPVVGFERDAPGFFWLAGQGGYGIQTSPRWAASQLRSRRRARCRRIWRGSGSSRVIWRRSGCGSSVAWIGRGASFDFAQDEEHRICHQQCQCNSRLTSS